MRLLGHLLGLLLGNEERGSDELWALGRDDEGDEAVLPEATASLGIASSAFQSVSTNALRSARATNCGTATSVRTAAAAAARARFWRTKRRARALAAASARFSATNAARAGCDSSRASSRGSVSATKRGISAPPCPSNTPKNASGDAQNSCAALLALSPSLVLALVLSGLLLLLLLLGAGRRGSERCASSMSERQPCMHAVAHVAASLLPLSTSFRVVGIWLPIHSRRVPERRRRALGQLARKKTKTATTSEKRKSVRKKK